MSSSLHVGDKLHTELAEDKLHKDHILTAAYSEVTDEINTNKLVHSSVNQILAELGVMYCLHVSIYIHKGRRSKDMYANYDFNYQ